MVDPEAVGLGGSDCLVNGFRFGKFTRRIFILGKLLSYSLLDELKAWRSVCGRTEARPENLINCLNSVDEDVFPNTGVLDLRHRSVPTTPS